MNRNPFKFGTVVSGPFFTNRVKETEKVRSVLKSSNHLILIGPRRFGKTSLIYRVIERFKRPAIFIDMQMITSASDLASQLLKRVYRHYPISKIRGLIKNFRIMPLISINPVNGDVDIKFNPYKDESLAELEDVLNLIDHLGASKKKPIIILDEFQEIYRIDKSLNRQLRSIIQHHTNVNYVFLGSQESMIREIFEKKKSPFYHFGYLMSLDRIPESEFTDYLISGFELVTHNANEIARDIIDITYSHPYYTQQLAFFVWEVLTRDDAVDERNNDPVKIAINELIRNQDDNYERLWNTLITTDRKIMISLVGNDVQPLSRKFSLEHDFLPASTIFSSIKRLLKDGFIIKRDNYYTFDDPFFRLWLNRKLE